MNYSYTNRSDYLSKDKIETFCKCAGFLIFKRQESNEPSVLLVESKRKSYQYSFPKGKRNRGENTLDAAKRELWEETGLSEYDIEIKPNHWYIEYRPDTGKPHIIYYLAYLTNTNVLLNPIDKKEIVSAEWFPVLDILDMRRTFYLSRRQIVQKALREFVLRERIQQAEKNENLEANIGIASL